jgi:hypothetical protein
MMDRKRAAALTRLRGLAELKKEAELAKLAAVARSRQRLESALAAVRETEEPLPTDDGGPADPAMVAARLAHRRWAEAQQRRINQQLALVTADFMKLKPAATRAFGRATVLGQLAARGRRSQSWGPS